MVRCVAMTRSRSAALAASCRWRSLMRPVSWILRFTTSQPTRASATLIRICATGLLEIQLHALVRNGMSVQSCAGVLGAAGERLLPVVLGQRADDCYNRGAGQSD